MSSEQLLRDQNHVTVLGGITDDSNQFVTMLRVDPTSKRLKISGVLVTALSSLSDVTITNPVNGQVLTYSNGFWINSTSSSGAPGGLNTQIQYNNSGSFGGITGATTNGTIVSLTNPAIGGATITTSTLNGNTFTTGTYTLTGTAGKTLNFTNSLTLSGTDGTTMTFPTTSATIARTDAANTFTGTQTIGALVATTVNGNTFTTGTGVLTIAASKTLTVSNSITLAGTDSTTMTFPSTTATIVRTDAAQTFTGAQTYSNAVIYTNNAIAASSNAATVPITSVVNTVTNSSAATLTITLATASAVNRQFSEVLVLDFSAVAQTITWVNTENSTVSAPTTSNGSTTLPLSVLFQYNSATSKWRCIASA